MRILADREPRETQLVFSGAYLHNPHPMNAIVVREPGPAENLQRAELPKPQARPGHVVARVAAAGVNPVDAGNRADPSWAGIAPPYVVGYEFAGSIDHLGDGVADLTAGQAVWGLLPVRGTRFGTYAEYVEVEAACVGSLPPGLSPTEAAALPLAGSTALQLLDRLALGSGDSLLIHGAAGGVGSLLVQLARMNGIRIAGSSSAARHPLLHDLGVEIVLDREQEDIFTQATRRLGGSFDAVADLVGGDLIARSLSVLREGGSVGAIVGLRGDFEDAIDRNLRLHGVLVRPDRATLDRLADAVQRGELRPIVDGVVDPDSIAQAHRRLETGHGQGKIVLRW
jgi:NADPH2:quinone reductase